MVEKTLVFVDAPLLKNHEEGGYISHLISINRNAAEFFHMHFII
jgi:hypothetical protein